jgi:nicotinate phosphoribosyltransferase
MVKYGQRPVMKLSTGKVTLVDKKQIYRFHDEQGNFGRDTIALREEAVPGGAPQLTPVMQGGRLTRPLPDLKACRQHFLSEFARLPEVYKALRDPALYSVDLSPGLKDLQGRVAQEIHHRELGES